MPRTFDWGVIQGHQPEKDRQQAARAAGLPILCSLAKSCPKYSGRQRPKVPGRGSVYFAIYNR